MSLNAYKRDKDYRIFGWHRPGLPYENYDFSLLWGVAYFSYEVDPKSGNYKDIHQWKTTKLVDKAKANGCKVFLTITNFGFENNSVFLKNPKAQETLVSSIVSLLALRGANGINIDLESVASEDRDRFTEFIILISTKLKEVNPDYMISLCLYAVDWKNVFDVKTIDLHIDFYTLMAYDYFGSWSADAGPVAPLKCSKRFGGLCVQSSVDTYINRGIAPKKIIVGVPYYGGEWITKSQDVPSKAEKFVRPQPRYSAVKGRYIDELKIPVRFEEETCSTYLVRENEDGTFTQIWFDSVRSLSIKYDWIKERKVGGVAIWALGYDDGYTELWELLAEKFS